MKKSDTLVAAIVFFAMILCARFFPEFFVGLGLTTLIIAIIIAIIKSLCHKRVFPKTFNFHEWETLNERKRKIFIALCILCPILGLAIYCNKRHNEKKFTIILSVYAIAWFLLVGFLFRLPTEPEETFLRYYRANYSAPTINIKEIDDEPENVETANSSESEKIVPESVQNLVKPQENSDVMAGIQIAEAEKVSYDRNQYQPNWNVGGGCNIRSRILSSVSSVAVKYSSNNCTVIYGSWNDPYTGKVLVGNPYQGDGTDNDLDIDHIIPLNYVNSHGGYYWDSSKKRSYGSSLEGMNNGVYLAVSSKENRKKSDKGPSEYYPPNSAYRCEYSKKWRDIARLYSISLSSADYETIKSVLISCDIK